MSDDKQSDEREDEKPEAGFDLNLSFRNPGFRAWGGKEQLALLMPVIKWGLIAFFAFWGLSELKGLWK